MNQSDKYIIDSFFESINYTTDKKPYLFNILNKDIVNKFYIDLYDKLKYNYVYKTELKNSLKKIVIDIFNTIDKRKDIVDKINDNKIDLIDFTDTKKKINILKDERQKTLPSGLFRVKSNIEALKEKMFERKNLFHPSQLAKKEGKVEMDMKKVEKVEKDLSKLFSDKKPEEIKELALKLVEQKPQKVKEIDIEQVKDIVNKKIGKELSKKLICKDGKILNKFTNKCVNKDSASGIFMTSKNADLKDVTKEDLDKYVNYSSDIIKNICKETDIDCENMNKKEMIEHIFNNINIHNKERLCNENKIYYKDSKRCVERKEKTSKSKKSSKTPKTSKSKKTKSPTVELSPVIYNKVVNDEITQQIKDNLRKKKPISCPDDKTYNKFTDKCVSKNSPNGIFLMSNYGNLNTVKKIDMYNFNSLSRNDLDKLCKKYPSLNCNFESKEELARHILDNVKIDTNELFCKDGKVYYHDVKKCIEKRISLKEKKEKKENKKVKTPKKEEKKQLKSQKKEEKKEEKENNEEDEIDSNDNKIYLKYVKSVLNDAYENGFIHKNNYEDTESKLKLMLYIIHKIIIKKLLKKLDNISEYNKAKSDYNYFKQLKKDIIKNYFEKFVYNSKENYDMVKENYLVDVSNKDIDNFFNIIEDKMRKILKDELSLNKNISSFRIKSSSPSMKKELLKASTLTPDIKKLEKIKLIKDIVLELIYNGNKDNLIGSKIKKNTAMNYLEKLLSNMKIYFDKMLIKENKILTDENRFKLISKFMEEYMKERIDTISKNIIDICLSEMTMENSRKWLNKYLPIALNDII
jgi:hypothetical protein